MLVMSSGPFRNRDALIISIMDTATSILAGLSIFSIIGNLAHESGSEIDQVVKSGAGLAFISYPEAVAKFDGVPQVRKSYCLCISSPRHFSDKQALHMFRFTGVQSNLDLCTQLVKNSCTYCE
jgi:hypothetical protein